MCHYFKLTKIHACIEKLISQILGCKTILIILLHSFIHCMHKLSFKNACYFLKTFKHRINNLPLTNGACFLSLATRRWMMWIIRWVCGALQWCRRAHNGCTAVPVVYQIYDVFIMVLKSAEPKHKK